MSHEPSAYRCPFCMLQQGMFDERNQPTDVVGVTDLAYARIAPKWWPSNPGALLVIPRGHHENLYDLPDDVGHEIWDLTRRVAVAMKKACRPLPIRCPQALTEGYGTRWPAEPASRAAVCRV